MTAPRCSYVVAAAASLGLATVLFAQTATSDIVISSRAAEVTRLARDLYRLDLREPGWTHEDAALCPAFTHHVFAVYRRSDAKGAATTFVAVYPATFTGSTTRDTSLRHSILLLPHAGIPTRETPVFADRQSTRATFNRVWNEERLRGQAPVDRGVLAACYARFAGEVPVSPQVDGTQEAAFVSPADTPVMNVQVPLASVAGGERWLHLEFGKDGMVSASSVTELRADRPQ